MTKRRLPIILEQDTGCYHSHMVYHERKSHALGSIAGPDTVGKLAWALIHVLRAGELLSSQDMFREPQLLLGSHEVCENKGKIKLTVFLQSRSESLKVWCCPWASFAIVSERHSMISELQQGFEPCLRVIEVVRTPMRILWALWLGPKFCHERVS
jgi:hypothetical protein